MAYMVKTSYGNMVGPFPTKSAAKGFSAAGDRVVKVRSTKSSHPRRRRRVNPVPKLGKWISAARVRLTKVNGRKVLEIQRTQKKRRPKPESVSAKTSRSLST